MLLWWRKWAQHSLPFSPSDDDVDYHDDAEDYQDDAEDDAGDDQNDAEDDRDDAQDDRDNSENDHGVDEMCWWFWCGWKLRRCNSWKTETVSEWVKRTNQ